MGLQVYADEPAHPPPLVRSRRGTHFPKPVAVRVNQNGHENTPENSPCNSPMMITPKLRDPTPHPIDRDIITRSPLKRRRDDMECSPLFSEDCAISESPQKRRALQRSADTFPTSSTVSFTSPDGGKSRPKASLSRSLGAKASSMKSLFTTKGEKKTKTPGPKEDLRAEPSQQKLRASMLAMVLVHKSDLALVQGLVEGVHDARVAELAEELLDFFDGHKQSKRLIDFLIHGEIQNTVSYTTLFRENSCATKLIGILFRREGLSFLESILMEHIQDIVQDPTAFEIDPNRVPEEGQVEKNQTRLVAKCLNILVDLQCSVGNLSPRLLHIIYTLYTRVRDQWTEERGRITANSFFFLRFVGPFLVSPPNLVSKVLQSVSNNSLFGEKEDFMASLNESLTQHVAVMQRFIGCVEEARHDAPCPVVKGDEYYKASELLQQKIVFHQHAILPLLQSEEYAEEVKEAITIFSNGKARQIMKVVTQDLKHRNDGAGPKLRRMLSPR